MDTLIAEQHQFREYHKLLQCIAAVAPPPRVQHRVLRHMLAISKHFNHPSLTQNS